MVGVSAPTSRATRHSVSPAGKEEERDRHSWPLPLDTSLGQPHSHAKVIGHSQSEYQSVGHIRAGLTDCRSQHMGSDTVKLKMNNV